MLIEYENGFHIKFILLITSKLKKVLYCASKLNLFKINLIMT